MERKTTLTPTAGQSDDDENINRNVCGPENGARKLYCWGRVDGVRRRVKQQYTRQGHYRG